MCELDKRLTSSNRPDYIGVVGRMSASETEDARASGSSSERTEPEAVDRAGVFGGVGGGHERAFGGARPLVLPETFDGTGSWDNGQKLKWLRVRMTGRAQRHSTAFLQRPL